MARRRENGRKIDMSRKGRLLEFNDAADGIRRP